MKPHYLSSRSRGHVFKQLGTWALIGGASLAASLSYLPATSAQTTETTEPTVSSTAPRFACQMENGEYTVMYTPESQPTQSYPWATPGAMGGGWTADRRCAEISRRLEMYRPDGLNELRTNVENGYDTVCVTTEDDPTCRIVFTVPQGQDPLTTRDRVFDNIASANSGESTAAVTTFQGGGQDVLGQLGEVLNVDLSGLGSSRRAATPMSSIDLKPFLDTADRGTGAYLRPGAPGRSLSPDTFR